MERRDIGGREVWLCGERDAPSLLVQPVGPGEPEELAGEAAQIAALSGGAPFCLAAFPVADWNAALSPWPAPPAFGDADFAGGADGTLRWLLDALLPALQAPGRQRTYIGGYSLAGLFALYAAFACEAFDGAAGASPSVWFPSWMEYIQGREPRARSVYLSLGDREERTRNPVLRPVGDNLRATHRRLLACGVRTALEWNPGNHFREPGRRTARGFAWLLGRRGAP